MSIWGEGWYADPQDKHRLRWWNGSAWTENTLARTDDRRELPRWWSGLSVGLQVALAACVVASAFTFYVDLETLAFVDQARLRPDTVTMADAERIDRLTLWSLTESVAYLVTGVLFITWLYTVHSSARMDRSALQRKSGWAIGGWLVPILSFWRPFQMVTDVRRGATGHQDVAVSRRQGWWWGMWLVVLASSVYVNLLYSRSDAAPDGIEYAEALGAAASWERYSCAASMLAAVLAILVVREIRALVLAEPAADA